MNRVKQLIEIFRSPRLDESWKKLNLKDDTEIFIKNKLEIGSSVIILNDINEEFTIPDGEYELNIGIIIKIKNSKIKKIILRK